MHFFDGGPNPSIDNYKKGQEWYRAHFPFAKSASRHCRTGEASPLYIFNPLAPRRIFNVTPEARIIAILRNPTERAISHYFHEKRNGRESLPISEALHEEHDRMKIAIQNNDYKSSSFIHFSYKSRGLYREQLERYLQCFSREQLLVLSSEEFFREPVTTLGTVFEFVGVDKDFKVKDLEPRNVTENRTSVDSEIYDYLDRFFLPHNQALCELLDKKFDW